MSTVAPPSTEPERVTDARVIVYLPARLYEDLREWAFGEHKSLSLLAREVLDRAVARRAKGGV